MKSEIAVIGAAVSIGGTESGSEQAPVVMQQSAHLRALDLPLAWDHIIFDRGEQRQLGALDNIVRYSKNIAKRVANAIVRQEYFLSIGGDHSCAIGTWSGAAHAMRAQGDLGLLWIDAHADAHTPESSDTGNIHGMPVAHLLGQGHCQLCEILDSDAKIKPENIALIGIRSYEAPEKALLEKLGVRVYFIEEVKQRGIDVCVREAFEHINQSCDFYGLSIDVDGMDPEFAPAVHTTVADGINADQLMPALAALPKEKFIGAEFAEFCPHLDVEQKTEKMMANMASAIFGDLAAKKPLTEAAAAEPA